METSLVGTGSRVDIVDVLEGGDLRGGPEGLEG